MRRFLLNMLGMATDLVPRQALWLLPHKNGRRTALDLWLKFALAWVLLFGPVMLLKIVSARWLNLILEGIAVLFCCSPILTGLNVFFFYTFPGIRFDEDGLLVKNVGTTRNSFYLYKDVMQIHQMTSIEKKHYVYYLELLFADGNSWRTTERPDSGIPFLVQLTDEIKQRCECPVSPVFESTNGLLGAPYTRPK